MLGPHFYYDLIRIARKGRTTLLRSVYLIALLLGIWVIYHEPAGGAIDRNDYARNAQNIAVTVVVLQYVVAFIVTPVYVCGAIIEEKKRRTLDLLFTTQLSNREIVLGKLAARLANLAVAVLASLPLLVFVQLWGGIDIPFLVYHYVHLLLFLAMGSAVCIWASAECGSLVEALVFSYALFYGLAYPVALFGGMSTEVASGVPRIVLYGAMFVCYLGGAALFAWLAVRRVRTMRLAWLAAGRIPERHWRMMKKLERMAHTVASPAVPVARRVVRHRSRIHRLAWPIRGHAVFWKECLKDGDMWSLSFRWLYRMLLAVAALCLGYWILYWLIRSTGSRDLNGELGPLIYFAAYGPYFVGLAGYSVWSLLRVTGTVTREREQNTLDFLLLAPIDRAEILWCKWLGSLCRAWPVLAIAYAGVLLGLGCGLYRPLTALLLVLLPWPLLLMLSFFGLFLSVACNRVLSANLIMACVLVTLFIAHLLITSDFVLLLKVYATLAFGLHDVPFFENEWQRGLVLVCTEQGLFLWFAGVFAAAAFYMFERRRSAPHAMAG